MEEQAYYCRVCNKQIHPKRAALGYKATCVEHSETKKFVGLIVTEGSESHEISSIEVIRDPRLAEELERLHQQSTQSQDIY